MFSKNATIPFLLEQRLLSADIYWPGLKLQPYLSVRDAALPPSSGGEEYNKVANGNC